MKCSKCNSDVLQSFRFCHDCGGALDDGLPINSNDSQPATPTPTPTRVISFDEFRKRKSNERVQHAAKKKQQKPAKDVLIGIGIMALTKGELTKVGERQSKDGAGSCKHS